MDLQTIPGIEHSSVSGFEISARRSRLTAAATLGVVMLLLGQVPAWCGPSLSGQNATEQGWPSELQWQAERDARTASEAEVSCGGTCALEDEKELKAFVDQWEKLRTVPRIEITRLPPGLLRSKQPPNARDGSQPQSPAGWSKGMALGEASGYACGNQPCTCGKLGSKCGIGALSLSDGALVPQANKKFKIDAALVSGSSEPGGGLRVLSYSSESSGADSANRDTGGQASGAPYASSQGGSKKSGAGEQGAAAQAPAIDARTAALQLALDPKSPDLEAKPAVAGDQVGPIKDAAGSTVAIGLGPTPSGASPATTDGGKPGPPQFSGSGDNPPKVTGPKGADGPKTGGDSPPLTGPSASPGGAVPSVKSEAAAGGTPAPFGGGPETPSNQSCPPSVCSNQMVGNTTPSGQTDPPQRPVRPESVQPAVPVGPPKPPQPDDTKTEAYAAFVMPTNSNEKGTGSQSFVKDNQGSTAYAAPSQHTRNRYDNLKVDYIPGFNAPPTEGGGTPEAPSRQLLGGDTNRTQLKRTLIAAKQIVDIQSMTYLNSVQSSGLKSQDSATVQAPVARMKTVKIDPSLLRITKASELTITANSRLESLGVQPKGLGDGRLTTSAGAIKVVPVTVTTPKVKLTVPGVTSPKVNVTRTGVASPKVTVPATKVESPAARVRVTTPQVAAPKVNVPKINAPRVVVPQVNVGPAISDVRLKRDIVQIGQLASGPHIYRYRYLWDDTFYVGVMAQEIAVTVPDAVVRDNDGYLRVAYDRLGLKLMTWDEWLAHAQAAQPRP